MTLIRPGSELNAYGFIRNITHFLPTNNIIIYAVSLNDDALQNLRANCNSTKCNVVQFDLDPFPNHAEDDRLHVYRPLVIQVNMRLFIQKVPRNNSFKFIIVSL